MRMILLGCYAPNAVKGIISGSDRQAAAETLLNSVGGKLVSLVFTRGEFDVVAVAELPDQNTAMGLIAAMRASGAFSKLTVLEELDMDAVIASAQKASKVYSPAG